MFLNIRVSQFCNSFPVGESKGGKVVTDLLGKGCVLLLVLAED